MNSSGFFLFRWHVVHDRGMSRDYAVAYRSPGFIDSAAYADLFEEALKGPLVPDALILVHLSADSSVVAKDLQAPVVRNATLRFNDRLPLVLACIVPKTFSVGASLVEQGQLSVAIDWSDWMLLQLPQLLHAGLTSIFNVDDVLLEAPPGFQFDKPSKKGHRLFIRSEQGLHTSGRVSFVALALLHRLHGSDQVNAACPTAIYVDTMGIASVAYSLRDLLVQTNLGVAPQIESFHSYTGIKECRVSDPHRTHCLISASTSMAMHRDWLEMKGGAGRNVTTLVTFEGSKDSQHALVTLPPQNLPATSTDEPYKIKIAGETFLPIFEAAKQVLLKKAHAKDLSVDFLCNLHAQSDVLGLYGTPTSASGKAKGVFLSGRAFIEAVSGVSKILDDIRNQNFESSETLFYQPDEDSKWLAEQIGSALAMVSGEVAPRIVDVESLDQSVAINGKAIVVAAVVGAGSLVNDISRALRNIHSGDRLYVIAAQFANTQKQLDTFKRNLELRQVTGSVTSNYKVSRLHAIAIGDELRDSFEREIKAQFNQEGNQIPEPLANRLREMRTSRDSAMQFGLLPSGDQLDKKLALRPNFAFWSPGYLASDNQVTVIATMAAVLQNARECESILDRDKLGSRILGQVCLDPENFASRFNDGLVQAALLRSARSYELDYRGDGEASNYFAQFIGRMLHRLRDPLSEAILEFLSAMATKKLQLSISATSGVVQKVHEQVLSMSPSLLAEALSFFANAIEIECLGKTDLNQPF